MSNISVGDLVIRKSHGGDVVFRVISMQPDDQGTSGGWCGLKGMYLRLIADAPVDDLEKVDTQSLFAEARRMEEMHSCHMKRVLLRRSREQARMHLKRADSAKKYDFFEVPGNVLHIDGDEEYLKMCLKTYAQLNIQAVGRCVEEAKQADSVVALIEQYQPDILILTGHDALIGNGKKDYRDIKNYRNSQHYINAVRKARQFEPARDDLVIFAGACQSYFEAILAAGANFASSPTRIFIHAYDPVFIAEKIAFTSIGSTVDVGDAINASVSGMEGVGGVETRGKFRLGMPKTPYA